MNNASAILSGTAFTMPQKIVDLLKGFISSFVAMLTLPYLFIQRLSAHSKFARFNTFNTNKFRAQFFMFQPFYRLFLHGMGKLYHFRLKLMTMVRFTLSILWHINTGCSAPFGNIAVQLSTYGKRINTNFLSNHFLFHSILNKGLNLIPLYQTEVSVIFCNSNQKVALLGQMAKCPY
jgi:hypothetical protein